MSQKRQFFRWIFWRKYLKNHNIGPWDHDKLDLYASEGDPKVMDRLPNKRVSLCMYVETSNKAEPFARMAYVTLHLSNLAKRPDCFFLLEPVSTQEW
jgi:hypothetical protein